MKPGDFIEWFDIKSTRVVAVDECVWSSVMNQLVCIGGIHLLIGITDDGVLTFLTVGGDETLLHVCVDDTIPTFATHKARKIALRTSMT
jgi:hypothetical protein